MMPQLDVLSFWSQAVCLLFFYFYLYFTFLKYFLLNIMTVLYIRKYLFQYNYAIIASILNESHSVVLNVGQLLARVYLKSNDEIISISNAQLNPNDLIILNKLLSTKLISTNK